MEQIVSKRSEDRKPVDQNGAYVPQEHDEKKTNSKLRKLLENGNQFFKAIAAVVIITLAAYAVLGANNYCRPVNDRYDDIISAHNNNDEGTELIDIKTDINRTVHYSAGEQLTEKMQLVNTLSSGLTNSSENLVNISDFDLYRNGKREIKKQLSDPIPPGNYTISLVLNNTVPSESNNKFAIRWFRGDNTYVQIGSYDIADGIISSTFTADDFITKLQFYISIKADSDTYANLCDIRVEALDYPAVLYDVHNYYELKNAIEKGGLIYLCSDITAKDSLTISNKNCMIFGNGHSITGNGLSTALMLINNGKKAELHDLNLYSDGTYNVVCTGSAVVLIDHCTIQRASNTVCRFTGSSNVTLRNCDIGYSSGNDGIAPGDHASVYIYNCYVHDNYDEGVSTHNSSYCEVHGGEFCRNGYVIGTEQKGARSSFGGVHLGGGRMGIVEGIYSHDNCTYGIGVINFQEDIPGDIEKVYNNVCENNGGAGIWSTGARGLTLSKNTIINNGGDAIHFGRDSTHTSPLLTASSGVVADNTMYRNANDNVVIDEGFDGGLVVLS